MSSSSKNTLNALHLDGIVYSVIPDLKTLLTPVLGRITELHAMEASHQLSRQQLNVGSFKGVLGELSSVRSLELGSNLVNFSVLFGDVLLSLPTLRHLVVVATRRLYHNDVIQQASQGDILGYLAQAPAAFKSLGMDAELVHHWSAQEHERVAEAAAAGGVAWEVLA